MNLGRELPVFLEIFCKFKKTTAKLKVTKHIRNWKDMHKKFHKITA